MVKYKAKLVLMTGGKMQHSLPLLSALLQYKNQAVYPLHTPGHKGGRGALKQLQQLLEDALKIDVSLMSELDDLHNPQSILLESQNLAAKLYGADASFFSVNGTTGALHAMLIASLQPNDKLLLPRNAHRSIAGSLIMSGVQPVYIMPEFNDEFAIAGQVTADAIKKSFEAHPDIKAVLLTSPNYYGVTADLEKIAQIIHKHNALLLVDEAHGPHLGFSNKLPKSALQSGADACAQSTHKIVGAMTQCSILHVQGCRINIDKVQQTMSLIMTTSPNYLLMASIDAACYQLATNSQQMMDNALNVANTLREKLTQMNLQILNFDKNGYAGMHDLDITKITINFKDFGITGFTAAEFLRDKGFAVELADYFNILLLITYSDDIYVVDKLLDVFQQLIQAKGKATSPLLLLALPKYQTILTPCEAFYKKSKKVKLVDAENCVASQDITFYPPGIPVVLPGEKITSEIINYCLKYAQQKKDGYFEYVNVVLEDA